MRVVLATALSFLVLGMWPAAGADGATGNCRIAVDFNLKVYAAKGISCAGAGKEMDRYKGSIGRTFKTPGGYKCKRISGMALGGNWRCSKGKSRAFRFEFSD